jgi:hypothetical protein
MACHFINCGEPMDNSTSRLSFIEIDCDGSAAAFGWFSSCARRDIFVGVDWANCERLAHTCGWLLAHPHALCPACARQRTLH